MGGRLLLTLHLFKSVVFPHKTNKTKTNKTVLGKMIWF